jgi:hypothetical protein
MRAEETHRSLDGCLGVGRAGHTVRWLTWIRIRTVSTGTVPFLATLSCQKEEDGSMV